VKELLRRTRDDIIEMLPVAIRTSDSFLRNHLEEVRRIGPDLIVYDSTCFWARDIADILGVPSAAVFTIFVMNRRVLRSLEDFSMFSMRKMLFSGNPLRKISRLMNFRKLYARYRSTYGLGKKGLAGLIANYGTRNLVCTTPEIQPAAELLDDRYDFIGPVIREDGGDPGRYSRRLDSGKKTVFVSLGTAPNTDSEFFRGCIDIALRNGYNLIAVCGRELDPAGFGGLPDNIIIEPFVPQMTVLPLCDVFVTHGGMNSTHEGLFHGIPLLFVPRQEEQLLVARRVEALGAGILVGETGGSRETLSRALESVLADRSFAENARRLAETFTKAGGAERGLRILLDMLYAPGAGTGRLPGLMGSCRRMGETK
jgi:MGT family glycosyltransferase